MFAWVCAFSGEQRTNSKNALIEELKTRRLSLLEVSEPAKVSIAVRTGSAKTTCDVMANLLGATARTGACLTN
jgi:hypothetical protein